MESAGEGEDRVFHAFREGGFMARLGMEDEDGEHRVRVVQGEDGAAGFIVRCPPAYQPPSLSSPSAISYRMLCFGGDEGFTENGSIKRFFQKSSDSCPRASSSSNVGLSKAKKKTKERTHGLAAAKREATATTPKPTTALPPPPLTTATAAKKPRKEREQPQGQRPHTSNLRATKVRKEKIGERITALQQLVSPFGKSDTASVLHEALVYIRFLHDQVQVLSSPYLQRLPSSAARLHAEDGGGQAAPWTDLRSRGLCLVPVACTAHVAACNGADFWSPAMGGGDSHHSAASQH